MKIKQQRGVSIPIPIQGVSWVKNNTKNANKFSKVVSCLKYQLSQATFLAFMSQKIQFWTQLHGPRH
jgi:hypothetical protein